MSQQYYGRGSPQQWPAGQGRMEEQYHDPRFRPPSLTPLRIASMILGGACLILLVLVVNSWRDRSQAQREVSDEMDKTGSLRKDRAYLKAKADELEAKLQAARSVRGRGGPITPPPGTAVGSALYWKAMYLEAARVTKGHKMQVKKSEANLELIGKKGIESDRERP